MEDLGSKNGTLLNGKRIDRPTLFSLSRISAGHLTIEFAGATPAADSSTVVFVEHTESVSSASTTVVQSLDGVLGPQPDDMNKTYVMQGSRRRAP